MKITKRHSYEELAVAVTQHHPCSKSMEHAILKFKTKLKLVFTAKQSSMKHFENIVDNVGCKLTVWLNFVKP